jgi:flagellar motor switch protein FliM
VENNFTTETSSQSSQKTEQPILNTNSATSTLDQSAIDNLMGVSPPKSPQIVGIKAMIDKALESYEKLPMLDVVFEKFARLLSTSLRNLTEYNVELEVKSIQSLRFGKFLNTIAIPAIINIFRVKGQDNFGILLANNSLIFSFIDVLFGGKKIDKQFKIEGRAYTSIEQSLIKQISEIILKDLTTAFQTISNFSFIYERIESDHRFASIARHADSAVLIKIAIEIDQKKGILEIVFPYNTLEPVKEILSQIFIGEQSGVNNSWKELIKEKIHETNVTLNAVFYSKPSTLIDIANLKVGSTIITEHSPEEEISLECADVEILKGKIGKLNKKVAISISDIITNEEN